MKSLKKNALIQLEKYLKFLKLKTSFGTFNI